MKMLAVTLTLALFAGSVAASDARLSVVNGKEAGRVHEVLEREGLVLQITGYPNHPFVIELWEDIKEVAGGSLVSGKDVREGASGGWEVTRSGPRLYVRSLAGAAATTMLVTSQSGKVVVVDLAPSPSGAKGAERRVSRVVIKRSDPSPATLMPPLPATAQAALAQIATKAGAREVEASPQAPRAEPALRNEEYSYELVGGRGDDILPTEVFDDGRFTWFRFPGNRNLPAIYKSTPGTQEEWLVNSHVVGDFVVLHGVAKLWVLRLEDRAVGVWNDLFDSVGVPSTSGTSVPGATRVRRQ